MGGRHHVTFSKAGMQQQECGSVNMRPKIAQWTLKRWLVQVVRYTRSGIALRLEKTSTMMQILSDT